MSFSQTVPRMNIPVNLWLDHEIVYITSAVDIEWQKLFSRKIYLWHKADFDHIKYLANGLADEFISK